MENDRVKFKNEFKKRLYSWVLKDTKRGDLKILEELLKELIELSNIIASSILKLKSKKMILNF